MRMRFSPFCTYPKAYWYLLIGMLINGVATFVLPFESIYLISARHLPAALASAIVAGYGVGSCLSGLLGGLVADRLGRRPTIIIGLLALSATTFGLAAATSVWLIALLTFGVGFWISWYRPASGAVIADLVPQALQARANSLIYWAYNLGMAVSPLLAAVIVQSTGYVMLFCIDGLGTALFCALLVIGLPETRPVVTRSVRADNTQRLHVSDKSSVARDLPFLVFVLLSFVLTSIYFQNSSTLPADMQAHGFSATQYGLAISVNGIVVVLLGILLPQLFTRRSPFSALSLASVLMGAGFGFTLFADLLGSLPLYASSIGVWSMGEILFVPFSAAVVVMFSPENSRGLYQGIARTLWGLSACAGPLLGGITLQRWGEASLWIGCAALGALVAGGFLLLERLRTQYQECSKDVPSCSESNVLPAVTQADRTPSQTLAPESVLSPEMELYLATGVEGRRGDMISFPGRVPGCARPRAHHGESQAH